MGMEFIQHESCVSGGNVVTPKIQNGEGYHEITKLNLILLNNRRKMIITLSTNY